ncbi:MAG: hypothetical protein M3P18_16025, partial [Actinomycetota bacterium]|nr:hypothetical protein [Actinomycetota bacterium]
RVVLEAFQMAEWRLVASLDHLATAGSVVHEPESVYAVAGMARLSIETSARAAWLLDPAIDGRRRGLRSLADLLDGYQWEAKLTLGAATHSTTRIAELVADAQAAGIPPVMNKSGSPLHFGEPHLRAVDVVELKTGSAGLLAFRELSGIAHATPTALFRRIREVPAPQRPEGVTTVIEGVKFAAPYVDPANLVPVLGTVIGAYVDALDAKVSVLGWSQTAWRYTRRDIGKSLVALIKQVAPPEPGPASG